MLTPDEGFFCPIRRFWRQTRCQWLSERRQRGETGGKTLRIWRPRGGPFLSRDVSSSARRRSLNTMSPDVESSRPPPHYLVAGQPFCGSAVTGSALSGALTETSPAADTKTRADKVVPRPAERRVCADEAVRRGAESRVLGDEAVRRGAESRFLRDEAGRSFRPSLSPRSPAGIDAEAPLFPSFEAGDDTAGTSPRHFRAASGADGPFFRRFRATADAQAP